MTITQEEIDDYFNNGNLGTYPEGGTSSNLNLLSVKGTLLYELEPDTLIKLKLNQVIYDPTNNYDSNNYVYNIPESGYYKYMIGNVQSLADYQISVNLNVNDTNYPINAESDVIYLNANDQFSIDTLFSSNVSFPINTYPKLFMYRI